MRYLLFATILTAACSAPGSWKFDTISSELGVYECARLIYQNPESISPLRFEMTRIGYEITAYLNLTQYRLTQGSTIAVRLIDGEETFEEMTPLLQGRMRLRLSTTMTAKIGSALQAGRSVKFLVDGFEETLRCENFTPLFLKLVKNSEFLQNILQGN